MSKRKLSLESINDLIQRAQERRQLTPYGYAQVVASLIELREYRKTDGVNYIHHAFYSVPDCVFNDVSSRWQLTAVQIKQLYEELRAANSLALNAANAGTVPVSITVRFARDRCVDAYSYDQGGNCYSRGWNHRGEIDKAAITAACAAGGINLIWE
ncbi:TPA: hypothetical protein ACYSCZ_002876 [Klebsiella oxytoca]